jgi:hypothetical protein
VFAQPWRSGADWVENSVLFASDARQVAYLWPQPMRGVVVSPGDVDRSPACDYAFHPVGALLSQRVNDSDGLGPWDAADVTVTALVPARGLTFWSHQVSTTGRGGGGGGGAGQRGWRR